MSAVEPDDVILGRVLRRMIHDPDRHPSQDPFVWLDRGELVIDGRISVSEEEAAAIERVDEGDRP